MTVSKKVTLSADGATATVAEATVSDVFSTIIDSNVGLTGMYGLAQKAVLFVGGMALQNNRLGQGFNPFKS